MNKTVQSSKSALVRESLVFQVKLIADGFRDFALVPISLIATAIGLIRGGDSPDTEFRRVIEIGQKTDQWINLFGTHEPLEEAGRVGSIDMLLTEAEEVVREQAREGGISEKASKAVEKALTAAHEKAREPLKTNKNGPPERDTDI